MTLAPLDWAIVFAYFALSIGVGGQQKDLKDRKKDLPRALILTLENWQSKKAWWGGRP